MTYWCRLLFWVSLGLLNQWTDIRAEEPVAAQQEEEETESFGLRALKDRFEAAAPAVGKQVPDLPVFTTSGERIRLHDLLLGHHSVLVFGCLT